MRNCNSIRTRAAVAIAAILLAGGRARAQQSSVGLLAPAPPAEGIKAATAEGGNEFGTADESVVTLHAISFQGYTPFSDQISTATRGGRWMTAGSKVFMGTVQIPAGAVITRVKLNTCSQADNNWSVNFTNLYDESSYHPIASFSSTLGCGFDEQTVNYPTGANDDSYFALAVTQSASTPTDGSATFNAVQVHYRRTVSPAPATASFADVPTTSPIFRFVEALKAAGITAGCDATHYCPNASLTRGQMAVYLATALGLHWPD